MSSSTQHTISRRGLVAGAAGAGAAAAIGGVAMPASVIAAQESGQIKEVARLGFERGADVTAVVGPGIGHRGIADLGRRDRHGQFCRQDTRDGVARDDRRLDKILASQRQATFKPLDRRPKCPRPAPA